MMPAHDSHLPTATQQTIQVRYDADIRYDREYGGGGDVSGWGMLLWIGLWVGAAILWGRKGR